MFIMNDKKITALFTNRFNGVSKKPYDSLNLGLNVNDEEKSVIQNRQTLAKILKTQNLIFLNQIHSDKVEILKDLKQKLSPADAIITNLTNVAIGVLVADCSPILIYDEKNSAIGAVHAGRAGIINKIFTKAALKMKDNFGTNLEDLRVFVGPNIKASCYKIGDLELKEFNVYKKNGYFDMNAALKDEFENLKICNFDFSHICTHCNDSYFSYRRDRICGRFAGIIKLY